MALLDQRTSRIETADGRFFVFDSYKTNRLSIILEQLVCEAARCRNADEADRGVFKSPIESNTLNIGRCISNHSGIVLLGGLNGQLDRLTEFEAGELGYAIPSEKITAVVPHSGWYGTGHDVHPVIDLRIKSNQDFAGVNPSQDQGRWSRLPLESGAIILASVVE